MQPQTAADRLRGVEDELAGVAGQLRALEGQFAAALAWPAPLVEGERALGERMGAELRLLARYCDLLRRQVGARRGDP